MSEEIEAVGMNHVGLQKLGKAEAEENYCGAPVTCLVV